LIVPAPGPEPSTTQTPATSRSVFALVPDAVDLIERFHALVFGITTSAGAATPAESTIQPRPSIAFEIAPAFAVFAFVAG